MLHNLFTCVDILGGMLQTVQVSGQSWQHQPQQVSKHCHVHRQCSQVVIKVTLRQHMVDQVNHHLQRVQIINNDPNTKLRTTTTYTWVLARLTALINLNCDHHHHHYVNTKKKRWTPRSNSSQETTATHYVHRWPIHQHLVMVGLTVKQGFTIIDDRWRM